MNDIVSITSDIIQLLQQRELEKAFEKVNIARKEMDQTSYISRSLVITEINKNIKKIMLNKLKLAQTIDVLPDQQKVFANYQIWKVCNKLFTDELVRLETEKRRLSKPLKK